MEIDYLILGAGPAGLSFANALLNFGIDNFLVLEKNDVAGGLCRSIDVDGSPFDIGGGHFLDKKNKCVLDFLFSFMPESEWNFFKRISKIFIHDQYIDSPFEANIWQFEIDSQIEYLKSIAIAGCNLNLEKPNEFKSWIKWKLGEKIADDYMLPYNRKMFGSNLDFLGTYWLDKLPSVSFEETLRSCLVKRAFGRQPAHAEFLYPKNSGYGELFLRMARKIHDRISYNTTVSSLDVVNHCVNNTFVARKIINTVPWNSFKITGSVDFSALKHTSIVVEYVREDEMPHSDAHWIYYPDLNLDYHRILLRKNFIKGAVGGWTETNVIRAKHLDVDQFHFENEYAYPLNTIEKPLIMRNNLSYLEKYNIYGLGRWGEWEHYNSDVVVLRALKLAERLVSR